jgi:hypothetical protein
MSSWAGSDISEDVVVHYKYWSTFPRSFQTKWPYWACVQLTTFLKNYLYSILCTIYFLEQFNVSTFKWLQLLLAANHCTDIGGSKLLRNVAIFQRTTQHYISEGCHLYTLRRENLTSHFTLLIYTMVYQSCFTSSGVTGLHDATLATGTHGPCLYWILPTLVMESWEGPLLWRSGRVLLNHPHTLSVLWNNNVKDQKNQLKAKKTCKI